MCQETEILDFLKNAIFLIPKALSDIRYVFRRGDTYMTLTADKLLAFPQKFIPLIFDDTSYRSHLSQSDKTDIHIVLHDQKTRMNNDLGFSIKSRLCGSSTLINSSGDSTNFVFSLGNINDKTIREFNSFDRFKKKFELLHEKGITPKWVGVGARTFYNNLMMVDTCLPWIIGECLLYYYSGKIHTVAEAEALLRKNNPLNFDIQGQPHFYEHKLKQFLLSFALGMTAATPWNGKYIANGGYIVVKEDGDIVCYHFFDRNELEDYLFNNTYFDTPSTKRHNFGEIYQFENEYLLKLNLQVRFLS